MSNQPTFGSSCVAGDGGTLSAADTDNMYNMYMGGQCCGALMDTDERHKNLQKLQAYKSMPDIPLDPMHTLIKMAKKWTDYDNVTTLTADQQKIFDQAFALSKEKPCCCKCWHYFTDEGIAKKVIVDGSFNAQQIADYWDASEICGI